MLVNSQLNANLVGRLRALDIQANFESIVPRRESCTRPRSRADPAGCGKVTGRQAPAGR
jgi:hypothetical protein